VGKYRERFIVEPGSKVCLKDRDASEHGGQASHEQATAELSDALAHIDDLQYRLYAERRQALLIVFQGLDAAGKDGTIRHVMSGVDPQGCKTAAFRQPTDEELRHDFLWRVHPHVPGRGEIAIFNRSHYEDVLVVRVHGLVPKKVWKPRYELINDFERTLNVENQTTIVKFFLHVSKSEQLSRFLRRLDDPKRNWKVSEADYREREYWDAYVEAYEDVLRKTSTEGAPWFVIPADHKWFCRLAVSQIVRETLEDMDIRMPQPTADLSEIRRKYHSEIVGHEEEAR